MSALATVLEKIQRADPKLKGFVGAEIFEKSKMEEPTKIPLFLYQIHQDSLPDQSILSLVFFAS